jgi:hypothetical protein
MTAFSPKALDLTAPEVPRPLAGLYTWNGLAYITPPGLRSNADRYRRWNWAAVEKDNSVYDWSAIAGELDLAARNRQRCCIGFGITCGPQKYGTPGNNDTRCYIPAYLMQDAYGVWFEDDFYPNLNHPFVQERIQALLDSFAATFGADTRISTLQCLLFGRHGEGYFPWNAPKESSLWPSEATTRWIIDLFHNRFAQQYHITMPLRNEFPFWYALTKRPHWGWSIMSLGWPDQWKKVTDLYANTKTIDGMAIGQAARERWKYAPIWAEWIGDMGTRDYSGQWQDGLRQIQEHHIALVGNGNFIGPYNTRPFNADGVRNTASTWTDQNVNDMVTCGKMAGYRFVLREQTWSDLVPGEPFKVVSRWSNVGLTAAYEPWKLEIHLRKVSNGQLAWRGVLGIDFGSFLPTGDSAVTMEDTFRLPADMSLGEYRVHLYAPPLNTNTPPLPLAIEGRNAGGGYELGTIQVAKKGEPPKVERPIDRAAILARLATIQSEIDGIKTLLAE